MFKLNRYKSAKVDSTDSFVKSQVNQFTFSMNEAEYQTIVLFPSCSRKVKRVEIFI